MSINSAVSLIDLSKQLPFEINDELKKELCFGETLIISCGHYEGNIGEETIDSEWSCQETSESETSEEIGNDKPLEITKRVEPEAKQEKEDNEENDFHFYFFPDCTKPLPAQDSKASLIVENGMPKINPIAKNQNICTCKLDANDTCECFVKLPCQCGATAVAECVCTKLKEICLCHETLPLLVCTCGDGSEICLCHPDRMQPVCTCDEIDKPCMCHPGKFPSPVCKCKQTKKIKTVSNKIISKLVQLDENDEEGNEEGELEEDEYDEIIEEVEIEQEPCECQKPDPKPICYCLKGKKCICNERECICGVQKTCICKPTESQELDQEPICKDDDSKSICSCINQKVCTCDATQTDPCQCFPKPVCICGDPDNCKCFVECDCTQPCICDTETKKNKVCICLDELRSGGTEIICTCSSKEKGGKKIKKVRAGKHGYRWCHEVDPRHTFFDFGYDRHDKISSKPPDEDEVKILGLHDKKIEEDVCPTHGAKIPPFKKEIRRPSLDCCSAVGGISINVECLGEGKDKFLVQVVSHSSKEGAKTGSKLVSILDCKLHTMEENRSEHITNTKITKERRSYTAICQSGYYNKVTRSCGERNVVKRFYHSFEEAHNLLLEGANIVLLRYVALQRYKGNITTDTVLMDGTICKSTYEVILPAIYYQKITTSSIMRDFCNFLNIKILCNKSPLIMQVCLGVSQAIVNGKPLFVAKIERHIIEPSGCIRQTLTVLTLRGYVVSHEWNKSNYILHVNPLLQVIPEKDKIENHAPLRERWREDLQLLSDYLDFKSTRTSEGARYVAESGVLTGTVRDYLQALLLLRPQDALTFTRHYFGAALSALDLPHDDYFDPSSRHVRYFFFEE